MEKNQQQVRNHHGHLSSEVYDLKGYWFSAERLTGLSDLGGRQA